MSSLPSWVASAFAFSVELRIAATAPSHQEENRQDDHEHEHDDDDADHGVFLPEEGPGLDLDERADRQLGDADGRPRRAVVAERLDVHLVHERVVAHVEQEHRRLRHVGSTRRWPRGAAEVRQRLAQFGLEPTATSLPSANPT